MSKLFTYSESSFTVLKSILNNQSIILYGLVRKMVQIRITFVASTNRNGLKRVDPTFMEMALATELFASHLNFLHIQNLRSEIYNLF